MPEEYETAQPEPIKLAINTILERVKPAQYDTRSFAVLQGYIGDEQDGVVKVYPQLDLRTYFNVHTRDIVYVDTQEAGPLSPTKLVIKSTAKIEIVKISTQSYEAGFLAGAIAAANLPTTQVESPPCAGPAPTHHPTAETCFIRRPIPVPPPRSVCSKPCVTEAPM